MMAEFRIDLDWRPYEETNRLLGRTSADLGIRLGERSLTLNYDEWVGAIRDRAYVSAYPLAIWLASSWWRIHHEALPARTRSNPSAEWRMRHEMASAGSGYVWPLMVFWSDRNAMNIRAEISSASTSDGSSRYLSRLSEPAAIRIEDFSLACKGFIDQVVERLKVESLDDSDLVHLWSLILGDVDNPEGRRIRRIEAQFGYDPEDCPDSILEALIAIENDKGEDVIAELAAIGYCHDENCATSIRELFETRGVDARPDLPHLPDRAANAEPWRQAKEDARVLRQSVDAGDGAVANGMLADLLGLKRNFAEADADAVPLPATILGPKDGKGVKLATGKRHPIARRFEMARLIGGYADAIVRDGNSWMASTDSATARQKYQRAFAAEFLCPIENLTEYLEEDVSDSAIEDAAIEFEVSEQTVKAQLMNNRERPTSAMDYGSPYSLVA